MEKIGSAPLKIAPQMPTAVITFSHNRSSPAQKPQEFDSYTTGPLNELTEFHLKESVRDNERAFLEGVSKGGGKAREA